MFERSSSDHVNGLVDSDRNRENCHLLLTWTTWGFVWPDPLPYQSQLEMDSVSVWIDSESSLESCRPDPFHLDCSQQLTVSREIKNFILLHRWKLHAVSVQSNLVKMVITTNESGDRIRDRIKSNATRTLRQNSDLVMPKKIWSKGGTTKSVFSPPVLDEVVRQLSAQTTSPNPSELV